MPKLETPSDQQYQHQLPKVSFRVITDDKTLLQPAGVHSVRQRLLSGLMLTDQEQSRSYGCPSSYHSRWTGLTHRQ